jgi:hypothetical protein
MKRTIKYILLGLGGLLLLYAGFIVYSLLTRQVDREIGSNLSISSDWIEITPEPPLKARNLTQTVILYIEGYKRDIADTRQQIIMPNGTVLNPEVQVIDEYGNVYPLKVGQWLSNGVGFTRDFDAGSSSKFPQDRTYTKVRIRSDRPFRISKVFWECYEPK